MPQNVQSYDQKQKKKGNFSHSRKKKKIITKQKKAEINVENGAEKFKMAVLLSFSLGDRWIRAACAINMAANAARLN